MHLLDWELWQLLDVKPGNPELLLRWQRGLSADGLERSDALPQMTKKKIVTKESLNKHLANIMSICIIIIIIIIEPYQRLFLTNYLKKNE